MQYKTNFFKKVMNSMYDIKVFSVYAKEGIIRAISYSMLLTLILVLIKYVFNVFKVNNIININVMTFIYTICINFAITFLNLLFNCLVVVAIASLFTIFMKIMVKYMALYSLTLYAATLPLIVQTILELANHDVNFDNMFIIGTLTYVILILKYIKDEIIKRLN